MKLFGYQFSTSKKKVSKKEKAEGKQAKSGAKSPLEYIDDAFADEIASVRSGIGAYSQKVVSPEYSSSLLRRNVHRLEKALCFPDSKPVFAEEYISETVQVLSKLASTQNFDVDEVVWAFDVLDRYFSIVDSSGEPISSARKAYIRVLELRDLREQRRFPKTYAELIGDIEINGNSFYQLCRNRMSCRWFENRQVEPDKLELAIRSASEAASACNRQPFRYLWIRDESLKSQIVNLPFGTKGFGDALPNLVMVLGDLSNFALPRDRHLIYIDSGLATSQLMLSLTAQGLASVPINWPDVAANNKKARELLGLEMHEVPIMLMGFGYPASEARIPFSQKKTVSGLLKIYD